MNTVASPIQSQLTRPAYSLWCAIVCAAVFCLWLSPCPWSSSPSLKEKCFFTAYRLVQCKVLQLLKKGEFPMLHLQKDSVAAAGAGSSAPRVCVVTAVLLEVGSEGG